MSRVRDNIDMYRRLCVECGTCREVCPSYNHGGCDPLAVMRGEYRRVFDCVGCGSCSRACEHTNPKIVMMAAYSIVLDTPVSQAFLDTGYSRYPAADAPGADLEPVWDGEEVCVMPGCVAKCVVPSSRTSPAACTPSSSAPCRTRRGSDTSEGWVRPPEGGRSSTSAADAPRS